MTRRPTAVQRQALALLGSMAVTNVGYRLLRANPPGGAQCWTRTNHRGEPITLLAGPACVLGSLAAIAVAPGLPARVRTAALLTSASAGVLGAYDDLAESAVRKGLRGHLGALARGEVTTGAVKVLGLAASGLAASALVRSDDTARLGRVAAAADVVVGAGVVAGMANLVNLLDLRPGRAAKTVLLVAAAASRGAGAVLAAIAAGSAAALLPDDLRERTMLGDTGANEAGALLGVALITSTGRRGRLGLLGALVALTLASERVSFTRVIESTPVLRELDALGRRPRGSDLR